MIQTTTPEIPNETRCHTSQLRELEALGAQEVPLIYLDNLQEQIRNSSVLSENFKGQAANKVKTSYRYQE
jgi:hypothetical protein